MSHDYRARYRPTNVYCLSRYRYAVDVGAALDGPDFMRTPELMHALETRTVRRYAVRRARLDASQVGVLKCHARKRPVPVISRTMYRGGEIEHVSAHYFRTEAEALACMERNGWTGHIVREIPPPMKDPDVIVLAERRSGGASGVGAST